MNTDEFVEAIRKVVVEPMANTTVGLLCRPPGRKPSAELVELSKWFAELSDDDQIMIERLLAMVARDSVFEVFAVLDGAMKVDPSWAPGDHFELRHVHGGQVDVISGPETALHELL